MSTPAFITHEQQVSALRQPPHCVETGAQAAALACSIGTPDRLGSRPLSPERDGTRNIVGVAPRRPSPLLAVWRLR